MPETVKVATACAELRRRLKNNSEFIMRELVEVSIVQYMDELEAARYPEA